MKEIWINLELYIKSYEFSIFRDFFQIFKTVFLFYFRFLIIKINKKIKKRGRGARVDATWHARPRGSATWTRAARLRGANISYIIILYLYIKGVFVLPYMGRVIPLETVGYYIPDSFV